MFFVDYYIISGEKIYIDKVSKSSETKGFDNLTIAYSKINEGGIIKMVLTYHQYDDDLVLPSQCVLMDEDDMENLEGVFLLY